MAFFLTIILAVLSVANAASLTASYPINAQLPPVARVSQPFRFAFAQSTFSNSDADTKYSLSDAPSWLKVDSSTRTLSGTPHSDDSGSKQFKLVASNGSEKDSMEVTLIVTADQGPTVNKPLVAQLQAMGPVSYPATLFIHPGRPFSIEFDPDTFENTHPSTIYYGTSPNNAPLPSWIGFDPTALKFSGNTPPFGGSGSQTFTFQLVASDVAGYSAANMTFELSIGPHILAFNETVQSFNLTRGDKFSSPNFTDILSMDGSPTSGKDLAKVEAELPDWLKLDQDSISLNGTPPQDAVNQNITIAVTNSYQDEAQLMVRLEFLKLFLNTVDGCEAAIGKDFKFIFNQTIVTDDSVQLDLDLDSELSWLTYFHENKTLYGHVPDDMDPKKFTIPLTARQGSTTDTRDFILDVLKASDTHENPTDPYTNDDSSSPGHQKAGIIAISVIVPVVVIISLLILFCCWRRRKSSPTIEEGPSNAKPAPPRPVRPDMPNCQPAMAERPSRDDNSGDWMSPISPSSDLPKLELGPAWNVSSFDKQEHPTSFAMPEPIIPPRSPARKSPVRGGFTPLRDTVIEEDKPVETSPTKKQNSRLSYTNSPVRRRTTNRSRREPLKPIQPRAMKRESIQSSKSKRYSKRSSGISSIASGLPVRFSGAGHGAGGFGPPGHGVVHTSWQNPRQSLMSDETSLTNMAPMFPRPPAAARMRHSMASSIPENYKRMTLRTVEPDESTISEADSLEAFVHSRAKHRNSSNPLFSAQISRRTSSALRALNRNHSVRSRADTVSVSTFSDEYRQSIHDRPMSTAISVSEYGDDNNARYSHYQNLPGLFPLAEGSVNGASQLSIAQEYRGAISPLPRFWSENSLGSARHLDQSRSRVNDENAMPQSSSMVSDLDEHLNRKVSPPTKPNYQWRFSPLEPPPPVKSASQRGLPIASSGELAFV
jgi:axial budding pattern protein 2